ncbi:MAG TPA: 6-bladed beta-propeller, partial [Gemmatimonadales bacterium]|nr:6-bladed beta-propeller [Gemmatimonadales bacterium]
LLGCQRGAESREASTPGATLHPDPRHYVREIEPAGSFAIGGPIEPAGLRALVAGPRSAPETVYGKLEGREHEVLGGIDDFATDSLGRRYVLDAANSVVRVVDRDGAHVANVGQAGQGPGDFHHPRAIAIDDRQRLLVSDMLRRIHRFEWQGDRFELDTVLALSASPLAMCTMDSLIVTQAAGESDSSLVQVYRDDGTHLRGFGRVYESELPILNIMAGQALLWCNPRRQEIVFASRGFVPDFRIFDLDGNTKKLLTVSDLRTSQVEAFPDGGYSANIDSGSHILLALLPVGDTEVLLQYGLITREARAAGREYEIVSTLLLDLSANRVTSRDTALPRLLALTGTEMITVADSTVPQVAWRRVSR